MWAIRSRAAAERGSDLAVGAPGAAVATCGEPAGDRCFAERVTLVEGKQRACAVDRRGHRRALVGQALALLVGQLAQREVRAAQPARLHRLAERLALLL